MNFADLRKRMHMPFSSGGHNICDYRFDNFAGLHYAFMQAIVFSISATRGGLVSTQPRAIQELTRIQTFQPEMQGSV